MPKNTPEDSRPNPRNRAIQSLERGMSLLEQLKIKPQGARLQELCAATGLSCSTGHGLLDTLVELGYVNRCGTHYSLGLRMGALAESGTAPASRLRELFNPALRAFNELCEENCVLAVPGGTRNYLALAALDRHGRPLEWSADARRDRLTTSAVGKVFLANDPALLRRIRRKQALGPVLEQELAQIGKSGFALDLQNSEQGLHCMAIPLRLNGRLVGALGTGAPAGRLQSAVMSRLARRAMRDLLHLASA
ncbi:helix-turn-helix domain-containing protein [Pseudomonas sp. LJDD11]|uniref:IclR family transcriptional regulator n=1 Tax=unclassified Pseudomonas TaxID=196821 RepID=UPI00211CB76B|nr:MULTISPECIES: helix-turn-helix domain-containing protein [unclassified Pseudomonas]MCQ9425526.1 helix-turn-helix domain-containing protein [Pseudomonas sp. LJDD11]